MKKDIYHAENQRVKGIGTEGFYFARPEDEKGDEFCEGILKDMTPGIERNRG